MDEKQAKGHVSLVAGLHIGYGSLKIIGALVLFMGIRFAWGFIPEEDEIAKDILTTVFTILPSFIALAGIIDVLAGILLFSYKQGARVFAMVISALNCLSIPIGTAIGVYSLWALMKPEVQSLFE